MAAKAHKGKSCGRSHEFPENILSLNQVRSGNSEVPLEDGR